MLHHRRRYMNAGCCPAMILILYDHFDVDVFTDLLKPTVINSYSDFSFFTVFVNRMELNRSLPRSLE